MSGIAGHRPKHAVRGVLALALCWSLQVQAQVVAEPRPDPLPPPPSTAPLPAPPTEDATIDQALIDEVLPMDAQSESEAVPEAGQSSTDSSPATESDSTAPEAATQEGAAKDVEGADADAAESEQPPSEANPSLSVAAPNGAGTTAVQPAETSAAPAAHTDAALEALGPHGEPMIEFGPPKETASPGEGSASQIAEPAGSGPPPSAEPSPAAQPGNAATGSEPGSEPSAVVDSGDAAPNASSVPPETEAKPEAFVGPLALIPEGDAGSPRFIGPPLVPPLKLLGEEVAPGSRKQLRWSASQSFAGGDTVAPVNVVHGSRPGPILCLTAAIHGDEINGVEIVRRIVNQADPDRLSGTLIGVPIVNLFGFSRNSRYLPDRRDLNRYFPGSRRGSIASRIADSFFTQVARHCEALVDFHTGSFDRANLPQVRADLRIPDVLRFSRGFGELPVLHSDGTRGMLRVAATQAGIPSVTFEVGSPGTLEPAEIQTAIIAIDALMHYLGMTPDAPDEQAPQAIFYDSLWVRANAGGLLVSDVRLGERVIKGQRLGVVIDPIKNLERPVLSPVFGRVIGKARNQVVLPGFAAFHLGEETSAEAASDAATAGRADESVEEDPDPEQNRDPAY